MTKINLKNKIDMNKPMRNMLVTLGTLFLLVIMYHFISGFAQNYQLQKDADAAITVSTTKVVYQDWQPRVFSVGNLFTQDGVDIAAQVDGVISEIFIKPNQEVKKGDPIIQLDATPDIAALESLQAEAQLAKLTFDRSKEQFKFNAVSAQELEENEYALRILNAEVAEQKANVDLKTIRAPFDGKLGVTNLSPGQFIAAGDSIISLQALDHLYVFFYLPEKNLPKLKVGQAITLRTDTYKDKTFPGEIIAIDPLVNNNTHNVQIQASLENVNRELLPGMYTQIEVITGAPEKHLTIPQAAISYNPYGNYVYVVLKDKKKLLVKQHFVVLGETRGDQVTVVKGLNEGDEIVSSGQLKLKNKAKIEVNNEIEPSNDEDPQVIDE